jgi:hypothetical protein
VTRRAVTWTGVDDDAGDPPRTESCEVEISADGLSATGTQRARTPLPYELHYELDAPEHVTRSLVVRVEGEGWTRSLDLRHDGAGGWSWTTTQEGAPPLDPPGAPAALAGDLRSALDCDLGLSPLTNAMPVLRDGLHRNGSRDYVMAWVQVPDLVLVAYPQRYEHLRATSGGSIVRFTDLLDAAGSTSDLVYDTDGLVVDYPGLARRS